jgi:DUF2889 family protein
VIEPPRLQGRDHYERAMHGWVDDARDDGFAHTVHVGDHEREVELVVVALPSPTYVIRAARCRAVSGVVAPSVVAGVAGLVGAPMVGGLTRRTGEVVGSGEGAALVVDAVVEVARLARQTTKMPTERAQRAASGDPWECWQLDTTGWIDLPDSCFTYSAEGRSRFGTRAVSTPMTPDLYSPRPGQARVFERRKVARLARTGDRLRLAHSMHDNVHGFEIEYEVDLRTGRIVRAQSQTPRLPYMGICSEPQAKIQALVGETLDGGLRKRLSTLVGGPSGCAQLFDLTADLLRLAS